MGGSGGRSCGDRGGGGGGSISGNCHCNRGGAVGMVPVAVVAAAVAVVVAVLEAAEGAEVAQMFVCSLHKGTTRCMVVTQMSIATAA
jgi:hypothetical protein